MTNYSLQEEELSLITDRFITYVQGIKDAVLEVFRNYETTLTKISYEPLYLHANKLVEYYNETTIKAITDACVEWSQDGENFVKVAKRYRVGEEAVQRASSKQQALLDEIETIMTAQDPLENVVLGSDAHFTLSDFEDLNQVIIQSIAKLEIAKDEGIGEFERLHEDNIAAAGIHIVAKIIGETVYSEFSQITVKALEELKAQIEAAGQKTVLGMESEVKEAPGKVSATLEQQRTELMNQVMNLFADEDF